MTAVARRAYGQARARGRAAAILSEPAVIAMAGAAAIGPLPGWRDLGPDDDGSTILAAAYSRLVDDHVVMRRAYPESRPALAALMQLHELENLKLLWRAVVRGTAMVDWRGSWRPLGVLQIVSPEWFTSALTVMGLTRALQATPYGELGTTLRRSHGHDVAAAELAIDRFGTHALASAHDRMPVVERSARRLLRAIVHRREALAHARASPTVGRPIQRRLIDTQPNVAALARHVLSFEPFSFAVPLALILMREEEVRRLLTLSEVRARRLSPVAARHAMEAACRGQ
jgi:vacuolar-type H+-ATPase subunit C/Vma6